MKWLKLAGIATILLAIISIVSLIRNFLGPNQIAKIATNWILEAILLVILFIGFFFVGKYAQRKFLKISSLISIIILLIGFILNIYLSTLPLNTLLSWVIPSKIILLIMPILYIISGIALFLTKEVKLNKISGMSLIIYSIVKNVLLMISFLPSNIINIVSIAKIVVAFIGVIITLEILVTLATFIILSIMFFKASKQFESNNRIISSK